MLDQGTWYFTSKSDPRWKIYGRGMVGMFMTLESNIPATNEAKAALKMKELELGEKPPDDLEFGYMKD